MKKIVFVALAVSVMLGCTKKNANSDMAAYEEQAAKLEQLYSDESIDEETFEAAFDSIKSDMLAIALRNEAVAMRLFEDRIARFLSMEQKAQLFEVVNLDSLEAHGFGDAYPRFIGELNTQAGKPMIEIVCATPEGDTLRLSEVVAKHDFVLVDFWASWCRPCRELMPELTKLYSENRNKLEIVSISVDKDFDAWKSMIKQLDLPWLHGAARQAQPGTAPAEAYGVGYIPTLFFIGHDGVIIAREPDLDFVREKMN